MRHPILALALVAAGLVGCVSNDYAGKSYAPTQNVEVFYDESQVGREYEVMGVDRADAEDGTSSQQIVQAMVSEAKKQGADGIIVDNIGTENTGSRTSTSGDDKNSTYTTETREKIITARFIKFRDPK